jgi:hypothetical protein
VLLVSSTGTTQLMTSRLLTALRRASSGALARTGGGDVVLFAFWRAEPEEMLDDGGPPLAHCADRRGTPGSLVSGLLWRSHPAAISCSLEANRALSQAVTAAGDRCCWTSGCGRWVPTTRSPHRDR